MNKITEQLQQKINNKTKPLGSLGKLENIALQIGEIQKTTTPELNNPTIIVFAADHGLADAGVSPYPKEVTRQMVLNFLNGGAAINVFCKQNNIHLKVVDAGVDADFEEHSSLIQAKIARGTKNILINPAMSAEECKQAINAGKEIITEHFNKGCNIIGFGEMGIGNTSSASLIMSKITGIPIDECTGKGTGHNDDGLQKKKETLKTALAKYNLNGDPFEILSTFGGFEIAMITGAFLKAAELNMTIMVDGFIVTSALLVAHKINPDILKNCIFTHTSNESGHIKMLEYLKAETILNLGMRLGEGTGAAVAFPVIQAAVNFLNQMSSFDDAGVSNKS
ncbi:MAG TPA: nicotinate-nucleotide--dimethylbenzimidazole phosphoribosyltransferase [Bacteroidales bacterium]|nr:nicotinate-nucleotide--dimethylbenzimidazole phosphoribosyltransferase [Bacteroidales bacterium]